MTGAPTRVPPPRAMLPDRRSGVTQDAKWTSPGFGERELSVTVNFYPSPVGRPHALGPAGELFVEQLQVKEGSALDGVLCEAGMLVSWLLQSGWTLEELARRLGHQPNGESISCIGASVRMALAIEAGADLKTAGPDVTPMPRREGAS